ncbi:hypothetical protein FHR36_001012 [Kitasatospora paracochleata]|uniref:Uncharacterized protein n=1 Tax=Kitasatospora paracochleata TaxID=58354 RepID=A0ABT1IS29_9ACTN|nr:hypothetical protein [Kitasatospora paracochleata]
MLASTVQFSNNDQTPTRTGMGPALHEATSVPSGPNNVPDTVDPRIRVPRRSSTSALCSLPVPNSQRSTHEQALRDIRPKLPCAP